MTPGGLAGPTLDVVDADSLRRALHAGELRLEYLPIVELGAPRVVGVEALLRWDRPSADGLAPAAFLDVAERSGVVVGIGRWVLETALRDVAATAAAAGSEPFRLSVNLTRRELLDPGLISTVVAALAGSGHPPEALCLEVSERSMVGDLAPVTEALTALKRIGVRVAIDDFGTGVSALSQLQQLPVDEVKIDRSFVARMHEDPTSAAIVRSIVYLARSLRLDTMAEGVELPAQERMLLGLRCSVAQGWLYATPQRSVAAALAAVDRGVVRGRTGGAGTAGIAHDGVTSRIVESAFEHTSIGMALIDGTGAQLAVNPALSRLLGVPATELIGASCWDAVDATFVPEDQAKLDAVLRGEIDSYALEERYVDASGNTRWVEVTVGGAPDHAAADRQRVRLLRQVRSIDDRKRSEERQALLAAVVDATEDAVVVIDRSGAVTHWNPGAERLLGWSAAEVVGGPVDAVLPPAERDAVRALLADVLAGTSVRLPSATVTVRDGSLVPCDITLNAVATADGPTAVVAVARDMREQAAAARALEEANARLRGFAHRVSHDLQQPLTALGGFLHLLDAHAGERLGEDGQEWVGAAVRSQRRLVESIDALLRTALGRAPALVPVDLDRLVGEALADAAGPLRDADAAIERGLLPPVTADPGMLSRALANLIANACRYRRDDEPLRLRIGAHLGEDGSVVVCVDDNGRGFEPDELEAVFREGRRGSAAVDRPGTGAGLAIVRTVMEAMGGRAWADRSPAGGARVCLQLPGA